MKITMLVGQEGPAVSRVRGDAIEVEDGEGGRLVDAGFALAGWASDALAAAGFGVDDVPEATPVGPTPERAKTRAKG